MSEVELEELARRIAEKIECTRPACALTENEQRAVRDLIKTKRNAVRAALWLFGAVFLWALKDVYLWLAAHITFNWGR